MGAQDRAEIAELVSIYLLKQISDFLVSVGQNCHAGLYRDDGLIYMESSNGPLISNIERALNRIFKSNHLKISIEQRGQTVNFLDVTLSTDGSFKPYRKPNSSVAYVSKTSNYPPSILKNIPSSIQKRLTTIWREISWTLKMTIRMRSTTQVTLSLTSWNMSPLTIHRENATKRGKSYGSILLIVKTWRQTLWRSSWISSASISQHNTRSIAFLTVTRLSYLIHAWWIWIA